MAGPIQTIEIIDDGPELWVYVVGSIVVPLLLFALEWWRRRHSHFK